MVKKSDTTKNIAALFSDLIGAHTVQSFLNVIGKRMPEIIPLDHYNFLMGNVEQQIFIRSYSLNFPTHIFKEYKNKILSNDFLLWEGLKLSPGASLCLSDFIKKPDAPQAWSFFKDMLYKQFGITDALGFYLHMDHLSSWGGAIMIYRFSPSPEFTEEEVAIAESIGEALAKAYKAAWENTMHHTIFDAIERIQNHEGNMTFSVNSRGTPVAINPKVEQTLRALFDDWDDELKMSKTLHALTFELIELINNLKTASVSKDMEYKGSLHRLYLSPLTNITEEGELYTALFVCDPKFVNTSVLAELGLTDREIEILNMVQEGKTNKEIGNILNIAERTVKFHINNINEKIGVNSKLEAMAKIIELTKDSLRKKAMS